MPINNNTGPERDKEAIDRQQKKVKQRSVTKKPTGMENSYDVASPLKILKLVVKKRGNPRLAPSIKNHLLYIKGHLDLAKGASIL
jgi:hypothetical protein